MSGRGSQVARIYAIFDILRNAPEGLTIKELHSRVLQRGHEIGLREISRDVDALQAAGFPMVADKDDENSRTQRWRLEGANARVNEHLVLLMPEVFALYLARNMLTPLKDTPFFKDLNEVFSKIEARIPSKYQTFFQELSKEIHFDPQPRWSLGIDPPTLDTIRAACYEGHYLSVEYSSANGGDRRVRQLGPQFLYFAKGALYLIAEDTEDKKVKVFSIARMKDAKMCDEHYNGKHVDPETFFKNAFGIFQGGEAVKVKVEFAPVIAPYVRERTWHPTQNNVDHKDGRVTMSIEVALTPELLNWVLGFGDKAFVLEPAELREQVAAAAEATVTRYRKAAKAA